VPGKKQLEAKAALARALCNGNVDEIVLLLERYLPDEIISLWQCEKALELVKTRGDTLSWQRLSTLGKRLVNIAETTRERYKQAFQAFEKQ
jgi:hypothetical protein